MLRGAWSCRRVTFRLIRVRAVGWSVLPRITSFKGVRPPTGHRGGTPGVAKSRGTEVVVFSQTARILRASVRHSRPATTGGGGQRLPPVPPQSSDIDVRIAVRIWDTPPAPSVDTEGHTPVTIESATGILVALPRPGVYEGYAGPDVKPRPRTTTRPCAASPTTGPRNRSSSRERCPADERYVLDLAFVRDPAPDDEDEGETTPDRQTYDNVPNRV